jgi:ribonuclease HI
MAVEAVSLWTDGGARGNPGPAAAGIVIKAGTETRVAEGIFLGEFVTNNQAEYRALLLGLQKARGLGVTAIDVHMDSQLVVEQVNGRYKIKDAGLRLHYEEIKRELEQFDRWQVRYVPRAENAEADRLVNQALDERSAA